MDRKASLERNTNETTIAGSVNLDGAGSLSGKNPIGFFEHMMNHLARYSMVDIKLDITGDTHIDDHHTVEDTGIVLGELLKQALGEKRGICRFGNFTLPMDETLTMAAVDFSGRPFFAYHGPELTGVIGSYHEELTCEFLQKLSIHAGMNLHIKVFYGDNRHHIHESIFKALGLAIRQAIELDPRRGDEVPSTKGTI